MIRALGSWKNSRVVLALIGYLQNDRFGGSVGAELHLPALVAQAALKEVTGHWFPLDVRASQAIWARAEAIADARQREEYLTRSLPAEPCPLSARLIREGDGCQIVVTNRSRDRVIVARTPESFDTSYSLSTADGSFKSGSLSGGHFKSVTGRDSFIELVPGESTRFPVTVEGGFVAAEPGSRELRVMYSRNGHEFGLNAWIGTLPVAIESSRAK